MLYLDMKIGHRVLNIENFQKQTIAIGILSLCKNCCNKSHVLLRWHSIIQLIRFLPHHFRFNIKI